MTKTNERFDKKRHNSSGYKDPCELNVKTRDHIKEKDM